MTGTITHDHVDFKPTHRPANKVEIILAGVEDAISRVTAEGATAHVKAHFTREAVKGLQIANTTVNEALATAEKLPTYAFIGYQDADHGAVENEAQKAAAASMKATFDGFLADTDKVPAEIKAAYDQALAEQKARAS